MKYLKHLTALSVLIMLGACEKDTVQNQPQHSNSEGGRQASLKNQPSASSMNSDVEDEEYSPTLPESIRMKSREIYEAHFENVASSDGYAKLIDNMKSDRSLNGLQRGMTEIDFNKVAQKMSFDLKLGDQHQALLNKLRINTLLAIRDAVPIFAKKKLLHFDETNKIMDEVLNYEIKGYKTTFRYSKIPLSDLYVVRTSRLFDRSGSRSIQSQFIRTANGLRLSGVLYGEKIPSPQYLDQDFSIEAFNLLTERSTASAGKFTSSTKGFVNTGFSSAWNDTSSELTQFTKNGYFIQLQFVRSGRDAATGNKTYLPAFSSGFTPLNISQYQDEDYLGLNNLQVIMFSTLYKQISGNEPTEEVLLYALKLFD